MFRLAEYPFSSEPVISPNETEIAAFFNVLSSVRSLTNVRTWPVHGLVDVLLSVPVSPLSPIWSSSLIALKDEVAPLI